MISLVVTLNAAIPTSFALFSVMVMMYSCVIPLFGVRLVDERRFRGVFAVFVLDRYMSELFESSSLKGVFQSNFFSLSMKVYSQN